MGIRSTQYLSDIFGVLFKVNIGFNDTVKYLYVDNDTS
jgi:hypothetical protein